MILLLTLDLSVVQFTNTGRAICPICKKTVKRKEDLERHKLGHKPGQFPCRDPACFGRKPFTREDNRNNHERTFHSAVLSQPAESQAIPQPKNDQPSNVVPTPQRRQNRKRPREESHNHQEANIENVHEKCRRLEVRVAYLELQLVHREREREQIKIENEQIKADNERLKIENRLYERIVNPRMERGR